MSSRKQRKANYRNSLLSTGPKAESLEHTRFNGVTHGASLGRRYCLAKILRRTTAWLKTGTEIVGRAPRPNGAGARDR